MKAFSQVLIVVLLVSVTGLVSCNRRTTGVSDTRSATDVPIGDTALRLKLPSLVDVQLKDGKSKTGQIKAIDAQKRLITIELDGDSELVPMAEIERVMFKSEESLPQSTGSSAIRGNETWSVTPLSELHIDPATGQAQIKQEAVTKKEQSQDFMSSQASSYVLQAMWFDKNSPDTVKLKVMTE
jgi:hypothetical protein